MLHDERLNRVLASESRSRILRVLRASGRPLSTGDVAAEVGLRPATVRFHLDLLASAGLADRAAERRATVGRPSIVYSARATDPEPELVGSTPAAGREQNDGYRQLAEVLASQIAGTADPAAAARDAGRRWADVLGINAGGPDAGPAATVDRVVGMLERLGFAPSRSGDDRIDLHQCPYEQVARQQRGVVCGTHAALLDETFERLGGSVRLAELEPFVTERPLLCVAGLRRVAAEGHPEGTLEVDAR